MVSEASPVPWPDGVDQVRGLFPATADRAYFNTAAVGLASRPMSQRLDQLVDEWASMGYDFTGGERDVDEARDSGAVDRRQRSRCRADLERVVDRGAGCRAVRSGRSGP